MKLALEMSPLVLKTLGFSHSLTQLVTVHARRDQGLSTQITSEDQIHITSKERFILDTERNMD